MHEYGIFPRLLAIEWSQSFEAISRFGNDMIAEMKPVSQESPQNGMIPKPWIDPTCMRMPFGTLEAAPKVQYQMA